MKKTPNIKNKAELIAAVRAAKAVPLLDDFWNRVAERLEKKSVEESTLIEPRKIRTV